MTAELLDWAVSFTLAMLFGALALAFIRLVRGPSLPDRVVALDLMAVLMVAFMALFTVVTGIGAFVDVALALALVAFLATVAFARFAERRERMADSLRAEKRTETEA